MASDRVDPLRAEVERLLAAWRRNRASPDYGNGAPGPLFVAGMAMEADSMIAGLDAALSAAAAPPEPPGIAEIERLIDEYGVACARQRVTERGAEEIGAARRALLSALRAAVQGASREPGELVGAARALVHRLSARALERAVMDCAPEEWRAFRTALDAAAPPPEPPEWGEVLEHLDAIERNLPLVFGAPLAASAHIAGRVSQIRDALSALRAAVQGGGR